jgi:hypothetical protein
VTEPPVTVGAVHEIHTCPGRVPGVARRPVGAFGRTFAGVVTGVDVADGVPRPAVVTAVTRNWYCVEGARPVTVVVIPFATLASRPALAVAHEVSVTRLYSTQ